ncbi:hypothetical protein MTO96_036436 [Rhipicephalus appendiculatus]
MEKRPNVRDSRVHDEESTEDHCSVYGDVAIAIAVVVTAGVLLGSLMLRSKSRSAEQLVVETGASSFCCPDKVRELARYVNSTLEPCENFFDYVCSNSVYSRLKTDTTVDSSLERFVTTGVPPKDHGRGGEVAEFMIGYFRSCVASIGRRDSFLSQMAQSILRVSQDVLRRPNGRNSFQFMVEMSVRYMIPSVLDITYYPWNSTLRIQVRAQCKVSLMSADCLNASVNGVRSVISSSVNISNTEKFMVELCRRFPATEQNSTYAWINTTEAISTQLWDARDIKSAMSVVGWGATNATVIEAFGLLQIRAIHDAFVMQGNCGPKAAYLLWHSVFAAASAFLPTNKPSYMEGFDHCMSKLRYGGGDLWQQLRDEVMMQRRVDDQVTATFTAVKQAVLRDAKSSWLFDDDDVAHLRRLIDGLGVVTVTYGRTHVASPRRGGHNAEPSFINEGVKIVDKKDVYIAGRLYDVIENASTPRSLMLNMAVLGHDLAEAVWNLVLLDERWNESTTSNINHLQKCFLERYPLFGQELEIHSDVIASSLGLASVIGAFSRATDWHTRKLAWSTLYMSHAQLFYLLAAIRRCPREDRTPNAVQRWVMPFMYVPDFARAFSCPSSSMMGRPSFCSLTARTS